MMSRHILFFLLFLLPFLVLPFGASHYEMPKVVIAEISIIILIALHHNNILQMVKNLRKVKIKNFTSPIDNRTLLIGVFFLSLVTLVIYQHPVTFLGNAFRAQGTFLLWLLILFASLIPAIKLRSFSPVIYLLLLIIHLYMAFSGSLNLEGRSVGTLGEPNAFAASAIFLWPWVLVQRKKSRFTFVYFVVTATIALFIILLSGSRSGLIAFGLQNFIIIAASVISLKKTVIAALILFFAAMLLPFMDKTTVYENRGEVWKTALIAGYEHPLLGWGFGNGEVAFKEYNKKLYNTLQGYYVDSSHNFLLDWWVQGGIVGLSIMCLLLYHTIRTFIKNENRFHLTILFGLLMVMAFNPMSIVTLVQFWWLIGLGVTKIE